MDKELRHYIAPNVFAMLGISCYILADTFFISLAAGADGLTALNLILPVFGLMYAIAAMIATGSVIRFAILRSRNDGEADFYFGSSLFWAGAFSLFFLVLGIVCPDRVLCLMGADAQILAVGHSYIRTVLCFAPAFILNHTFTAFVRNDGRPKLAMAATMASSFFNIAFDWILMFPLGLGMFGAALASGLSPLLSIAICLTHYLSRKNTVRLIFSPSLDRLVTACVLGVSAFIGEISNGVTNLCFNFILLSLAGNTAVAAYGVAANLSIVVIAVFNGISQGLQPLAGRAAGQDDRTAVARIKRQSLAAAIAFAFVSVLLLWLFAPQVVAVFNSAHNQELAAIAIPGLRLYSLGFLLAGCNIIIAGVYAATGRAKEGFVISILRGLVLIVAFAFLLSRFFGLDGVWLSFTAAEAVTLVVACLVGKAN